MKLPKASKINFAQLGGMLVGYKVADVATTMVRKKDATTGFLDGMLGGAIKVGAGLAIGMYSKPGSLMQGIGDGVAFNGGVTLLRSAGVSMGALQGNRLGLGAEARYNRLNSQIAGGRTVDMADRQHVHAYSKVA